MLAQPFDSHRLYTLADRHGLLPTLNLRLGGIGSVPAELHEKLAAHYRTYAVFTLRLSAELFRVLGFLHSLGLEALCTKGPALSARCYGDPSVRQFTDLDLIVRHREIRKTTQAMLELGFTPRVPLGAVIPGRTPGEYVFRETQTGVIIELHTERTFRYYPRGMQIENIFARKGSLKIDEHLVPVLSLEDELVLICIHAAKHLWERLAWVADVAALLARNPNLDCDRVATAAQEVRAERMIRIALRLTSQLLDAPLTSKFNTYIAVDRMAAHMAHQIARRPAAFDSEKIGIFGRAAFRMSMREGLFPGLAYLTRLTLSPTEDDWTAASESKLSRLTDAIGRPFRLAKKYRREHRRAAADS